MFMPYAIELWF